MNAREPRRHDNAGAFLGPDLLVPVPMRTLSDDYADRPVEPKEDRVPEPDAPGRVRQLFERLARGTRPRP